MKPVPSERMALSRWAGEQTCFDTNPDSPLWQSAPAILMRHDAWAQPVPGHTTEVRSLWTSHHLYFLFICPYQDLSLKPDPVLHSPTSGLWNWDVAEVFIGSHAWPVWRYKEFEMSPQGEWLDLDIDAGRSGPIGSPWVSGYTVTARIDRRNSTWYGLMRIPLASVGLQGKDGEMAPVNFFRSQGPDHLEIAWQATFSGSFHVPERFGTLKLLRV